MVAIVVKETYCRPGLVEWSEVQSDDRSVAGSTPGADTNVAIFGGLSCDVVVYISLYLRIL